MNNIVSTVSLDKSKISASSIKTFLSCKMNWLLYKQVVAKKEKQFFKYGTVLHGVLELHYAGKTDVEIDNYISDEIEKWRTNALVTEEALSQLEVDLTNLKNVFNAYRNFWKEEDKKFKIIDIEKDFELDLFGVTVKGRLDMVVEDDLGGIWVLEHKSAAQFVTEKYETDFQVSLYSYVASLLYPKFEGVIVNLIRKKATPETEIPRLKNGSISVDKNKLKKVPYDLLKEAVTKEESGERLAIFNDILLNMKYDNYFFKRYSTHKSERELKIFESYIGDILEDFQNTENYYPSPNGMCPNTCQYYDICKTYQKGLDYETILVNFYEERNREEKNIEEND